MSNVQKFVEKYQRAAASMAEAWDEIILCGLFERAENPGKFDVVVSAPHLRPNRDSLLLVAEHLPNLTPDEVTLLGRIVIVQPDGDFLHEVMHKLPEFHSQFAELGSGDYGDVPIVRAYVFLWRKEAVERQEMIAA